MSDIHIFREERPQLLLHLLDALNHRCVHVDERGTNPCPPVQPHGTKLCLEYLLRLFYPEMGSVELVRHVLDQRV